MRISVILPVFNGGKYIDRSISSILAQTLKDFELIVVDDGSTDNTLRRIKLFKDKRIRVISRENKGLVASLNEGISLAKGELIARQDADDISEPQRLEKQLEHFDSTPELVLLGASIITINEKYEYLNTHHVITGNVNVKAELLVRSPFAHGSVMFKKEAFHKAGGYLKNEWPAEDYGLWIRMAKHGKIDNLPDPLYRYMENSKGISSTSHKIQLEKAHHCRAMALKNAREYLSSTTKRENPEDPLVRERVVENYAKILMSLLGNGYVVDFSKLCIALALTPSLLRAVAGKMLR